MRKCLLLLLLMGPLTTHPSRLRASSLPPEQPNPNLTEPPPIDLAQEMRMQRAWMYSALVPGLGQAYNRHYRKVPVIYLGAAVLAGGAFFNHTHYLQLQKITSQKEKFWAEDFSRNRDLFLIFLGMLYLGNIFDAYAGAALDTFQLSDDLMPPKVALRLHPDPRGGLLLTLNYRL